MSNCVIEVTNKSKGSVIVVVDTNPALEFLGGSLAFTFPGYERVKSFFIKSEPRVQPMETKVVNEVSPWKFFTYGVGCTGAEWYYIIVIRDDDAWEAVCKTPLHCTWIVDDDKIYQQDKPSECEIFRSSESSKSSIRVTNKTEEAISVVVYPCLLSQLPQLLIYGLREISSHVREKYFNEGVLVEPKKTKTIFQKKKSRFNLFNLSTYCIRVIRKRDKRIAQCETPLHCIWIVESHGMCQKNKPKEVYKFS